MVSLGCGVWLGGIIVFGGSMAHATFAKTLFLKNFSSCSSVGCVPLGTASGDME